MRLFLIFYLLLASNALADGPPLYRDTTTKVTSRMSEWSFNSTTQDVDTGGNKITGLGTPSATTDAATKDYVDTNFGDASGPASSTDNAVARFDGAGGKTLQNSGVTIDDSDNMAVPGVVSVGDGIVTTSTITFDTSQASGTDLSMKQGLVDGLAANAFRLERGDGDIVMAINGLAAGTTNQRLLINPTELIGADTTSRDYQLGFGKVGVDSAHLTFNLGNQSLPTPLQDEQHEHVSIDGALNGGLWVNGPVVGSGGGYFGGVGRSAVIAKDGAFLGTNASAGMKFIPQAVTHTCDNTDLTETGGPGAGTDPCIRPLHQFAAALPDLYSEWSFGSGNDARTGRPYNSYVFKRYDTSTAQTLASPDLYSTLDRPAIVWDGLGLILPSGPIMIGGAGTTNGIAHLVDGDPIIALAYGTDLDGSIGAFWSPISWGNNTDAIRFGVNKISNTDVPHLRADHDLSAVAFRETGVQLMAASASVSKATARVRLDGSSATVVGTLFDCDSDSDGSVVRFAATDVTNPISVAAFAGDSFLGGAPTFTAVGDSATVICYGANNEWEVY